MRELSLWILAFIVAAVWARIAARFKYAPDDFLGPAVTSCGPTLLLALAVIVRGIWLLVEAWTTNPSA